MPTLKVYLDDVREPPEGWTLVRWPYDAIQLLLTGEVEALSLDHDLGDDGPGAGHGRTGYDVLVWLEEAVALHGVKPPASIQVHSANPAGRARMEAAIESIQRLAKP